MTGVRRASIDENSPGSNDGTTSNSALKVSGRPFFDLDVADVGRVDRLDAALRQPFLDGALDELVRDVVQDLTLEPLPDHLGRHLARAEARQAGGLAVFRRDAGNFGVHDVRRNFYREIPARLVDVDEVGFH